MYLVEENFCEIETYFFNTEKEMLNYYKVNSIDELLNKSNVFRKYTIFKVEKVYKK